LNCNILFFVVIGNLLRLSHFGSVESTAESTNEDGTKSIEVIQTPVTFSFVFATIFVIPAMTLLFIFTEFQVFKGNLLKYFLFLNSPISKGVYLIMIALMLLEVSTVTEVILAVVIITGAIFDIVLGCIQLSR
jgi:hypothetical protein